MKNVIQLCVLLLLITLNAHRATGQMPFNDPQGAPDLRFDGNKPGSLFQNSPGEYPKQKTNRIMRENVALEAKSFIGLGYGPRKFNYVPQYYHFKTDSVFKRVNLGGKSPKALNFLIPFLPSNKGFGMIINIQGWLGKSAGFSFDVLPGYKFLKNERFSLFGYAGLTFGYTWLDVDVISIDSSIVSAQALGATDSEVLFLGRGVVDASGKDWGSDIYSTVGCGILGVKPGVHVNYELFKGFYLFTDFSYNLVYAKSKLNFSFSGRGWDNMDDLVASVNSDVPTHVVTVEMSGSKVIENEMGEMLDRSPVKYSGPQLSIGFGIGTNAFIKK